MRIQSIRLDGFGRLSDVEWNLTPGLNVFFGSNEAGKSTLQQAILALLYGFYKTNRRSPVESELLERFRPWQGAAYGGGLVYELDNGRSYRVTRAFADELETTIAEADTGREVTAQFEQGRLGRVDYATRHLGMSPDIFVNTCFVRQADLHRLEQVAKSITETIVNLADTGDRDRSVVHAQEILGKTLKEQVGGEQAKTKPLPKARQKLNELRKEKQTIEDKRRAMETDYATRSAGRTTLSALLREQEVARYLLAAGRMATLNDTIAQIERLAAAEAEHDRQIQALGAGVGFPRESRDEVTRLERDRAISAGQVTRFAGMVESRDRLAAWQSELAALLERRGALEPARATPLDQQAAVAEQGRQWTDLARICQADGKKLMDLDQTLAAHEPVRAAAGRHQVLLDAGADKLRDLNTRWEIAHQQLDAATATAAQARSAWQRLRMSSEEFHRSADQVAGLDLDAITELKAREAAVQLQAAQRSAPARQMTVVLTAAALLAVVGLVLVGLGLAGESALAMFGAAVVVADIVMLGIAVLYLQRGRRSLPAEPASDFANLAPDLAAKGLHSIAEVERTYLAYVNARPVHASWTAAEEAVAKCREQAEQVDRELLPVVGVASPADLTHDAILAAERQARELALQLNELEKLETDKAAWLPDMLRRLGELEILERALRERLATAGCTGSDLAANLMLFAQACEDKRALDQIEARQGELEARIAGARAIDDQLTAARGQLAKTESDLRRLLEHAGIAAADLGPGVEEFNRRLLASEKAEVLRNERAALAHEHQALLGSQTLDQLKAQAQAVARERDALLAGRAELSESTSTDSAQVLQARLDGIALQVAEMQKQLAVIETRLAHELKDQRSLAQVQEEIDATEDWIGRLVAHAQALEEASKRLAQAADDHHRNFLPRLNQIVGQSLDVITGGRYTRVQIDHEDLQVRLTSPEADQPVTPDALSRGTQEQIYLLLRLGLAELLSDGREQLPLILDDPLVNYDAVRLVSGLGFLARMAEQAQVLLFTKDQQAADWFESAALSPDRHRLHRL